MAKEEKKELSVPEYSEDDYKKALTELDETKEDDFFGKKTFTETGSTLMALIKAIVYIVFIVAVSAALAYFAIVWVNDAFAFVKEDKEITVTIPEYTDSADLAEILGDAGVVNYPGVFKIYSKLKKVDEKTETYKFVAGTYTVNSNMNYDNLLRSFHPTRVIEEFSLTIPEGYTVDEIIRLFLDKGIGTMEGWVDAINNYDYGEDFPYIQDIPEDSERLYRLEGYLFPNTYRFYSGEKETYYIEKLLSEGFNRFVYQKIKEDCAAQNKSLDEILTVASICEKEAYFVADKARISMVIRNRLNHAEKFMAKDNSGALLQCDSMLIYYLSHVEGQRVKELTQDQLEDAENPYNSYQHGGLLHGPICNPSFDAIMGALEPDEEYAQYYFFVTDNQNIAIFCKTEAEFNAVAAELKSRQRIG